AKRSFQHHELLIYIKNSPIRQTEVHTLIPTRILEKFGLLKMSSLSSLSSDTDKDDLQIHENEVLSGKSCKYLVRNLMGEGTFGQVARCLRLDTMENVAVKIVRKEFTCAGKKEVRALQEVSILDLNKSNLVTFFESFMHKGHVCIVVEKLQQSLHDFMKERKGTPLCVSEIRVITHQVLVALKALKSIDVVHGDIKPDNIMLVNHYLQPYRVKLIDFGLTRPVSTLKRGTVIQALAYRAPEVILGLPIDEAADMWSLGCVMAFFYLNRHLFPLRCEYEVIRNIVQIRGQPSDLLLDDGIHTNKFFNKNKDQGWRLNTQTEYLLPKTDTESQDTRAFLSLLKRMLAVDSIKRLTPTEALGHRFITMRHLSKEPESDPYVTLSYENMKACPSQDPTDEISCFVTSSEVSHGRESTASTDTTDSPSPAMDSAIDDGPPATNPVDLPNVLPACCCCFVPAVLFSLLFRSHPGFSSYIH
uniref:Protein kinase domain-containing protein n=1 Tax=Anabas testudineus TaxID=64144 RepID=A0A7N6AXB6_ANATE